MRSDIYLKKLYMAKRNGRNTQLEDYEEHFEPQLHKILGRKFRLKCKNEAQKEFSKLITEKEIVIAAGPAGTGKSFVAIARGIELLQNVSNTYNKVVISKPAVESEEKLGFMPGDMREKLEPHLSSSLDIVDKIVGKANRMKMEAQDLLVIQPLGFIRGKTFDNSIIIVEEAQNLSGDQCKALLSRIGYGSKLIISGDLDQSDRYKDVKQSGLYDLFVKHRNVEEIGFYQFGLGDIVRNPLISKLLGNYETHAMPDMSMAIPNTIAKTVVRPPNPPNPVRPKIRVIPEGSGTKLGIFNGLKTFFSKKFAW